MSINYQALRKLETKTSQFKKGDYLVLFGELFAKGYANGLVAAAEKAGMNIIRATVGRREKTGELRALNQDELNLIPKPIINIPLEAGFDMEPSSKGHSPIDLLKDCKLNDWQNFKIDFEQIQQSKLSGEKRFRENVRKYLHEVEALLPKGANVLFAHLMAGGVPRAKIVMPLMNRAFKGTNDRHIPSNDFWASDIGQLCSQSFESVTANTFDILVSESSKLREKINSEKGHVSYIAYGYHGTEVLINNKYQWQTYTPYLQGWAKMNLEKYSDQWKQKGVNCCVYNCPEILTNSSNIFQGVEISLYPLLGSLLKKHAENAKVKKLTEIAQSYLKEDVSIDNLLSLTNNYLASDLIKRFYNLDSWPMHNSLNQMNFMIQTSDQLFEMHKNQKELLTLILSEVVIESCGFIMLNDSYSPAHPYTWINHDIITDTYPTL